MGWLWQWVRRHPWLALAAALALVAGAVALVGRSSRTNGVQRSFFTVKRGDFLISIVEGGTLRALKESSIRSEVESSAKIISIIPEGNYVRKGDLLVELESNQIKESLDAQEITLENSNFSYLQAQERLAIQKSLAESNIKDAEMRVEFAKSDLEKYIEGDWPQQKNKAANAITLVTEDLVRAKDRMDWTEVLAKKGYATKSELQADSLGVKQKEIALAQAEEELRLLEKYDYPKKKRLFEATVESNEKELERLRQRSNASIAEAEADLASRKRMLTMQQEKLDELKKQFTLTKIYAPTEGLVVYSIGSSGSYYSGVLIEEGTAIRFRQEVIKLPDISQMVIEVRVHETHITKIQRGQVAYVTIDSMPDLRLKGHVHKVGVLPDSSSRYYNPTLKVYTCEVLIEDKLPEGLKPGVSGRAEIVITNLQNVLAVPLQAVTSIKGEQVCFVGKGGEPQKRPVEIGLYNDKYIEIKTGLKEGDELLLAPLLTEADAIDLSGSIVDANEYEADQKAAAAKKGKKAGKGAGSPAKQPAGQTLQPPPLSEFGRGARLSGDAPPASKRPASAPADAGAPASRKSGQAP
ncbi:MAG: HlyD family efflux transporter periplasmic adaptor subunit [Verrucomicrobia bacterium]|nr:HlyD family efflux transporter periplasmic adaptor subunit [Verrucomicrobiota bacterium]